MNKILYLTYDGLTDPLGQSQVLPYLIELSKNNEIHIISCEKKDNLNKFKQDIDNLLIDSNIQWHPLKYNKKPPILSTLNDLWRMYLKSVRLHKLFHFSLIHCRSHLTSIIGQKLKNKKEIPYIFDMRSFFPEERVDGGLWPQSNYIYKLVFKYFKKIEKEMLETADHVIVLTQEARKILNLNEKKISVIPCCADFEHFDYNKITEGSLLEARESLNISKNNFVLSYLGSLGTWYMLDEMLDFFIALKKVKSDAVFLFITPTDRQFILDFAKEKNISEGDLRILFEPRKKLPVLISLSTISIFFIKNTFSKKASSPTKHAELMGLGIPVITNSGVGDVEKIILENNSGEVINIGNLRSYDQICLQIDDIVGIEKEEIRKSGMKIFSLKNGVHEYQKVYSKLEKLN